VLKSSQTSSEGRDSTGIAPLYAFAGYLLDPLQRLLRRQTDGQTVHLTARVFDALRILVERHGQLVDKSTLMRELWPQVVVEEGNLTQTIYTLRQALGEKPGENRYIATIPGRGYRFVAEVQVLPRAAMAPLGATSDPSATETVAGMRPLHWAAIALVLVLVGSALWLARHGGDHRTSAAPGARAAAAAAAPADPRTSVAVLPFANLTGDATKEYWGDGMAEELINTLSKIPGMKVPARSSTFAYKGRNVDARQIARDLGVGTVLEGSVRTAGDRIRVNAQLSDATSGFRIWSESYDRRITDLFKLQDELAVAIERALRLTLAGGAPITVTQAPPTRNVEAYRLTLQGFALIDKGLVDTPTMRNTILALDFFKRAIAIDPKYARAYGGLSIVYFTSAYNGNDWARGSAAAERAARQALALDPDSVEGESMLAELSDERNDLLDEEVHYRRALALDPNDGHIRIGYALGLAGAGHLREAIRQGQQAYELLPTNLHVVSWQAFIHTLAGETSEALKYADLALKLGVPEVELLGFRSEAALRAHRYADYSRYLRAALPPGPDRDHTVELTGLVIAALNDPSRRAAALAARWRLYPRIENSAGLRAAGWCAESARLRTAGGYRPGL